MEQNKLAEIHFFHTQVVTPSKSVLVLKRTFDIALGVVGTLLFFLILPFIALIIRLESKGPVLYRQTRVGRNSRFPRFENSENALHFISKNNAYVNGDRHDDVGGKPFGLLKFRTMYIDAEAQGPQLCNKNGDPRITKVGCWLRFFHIDEIPQFWNILKGDMSFIGPRPERPFFTKKYLSEIPLYRERLRFCKPGLTGLAQITLGYDESLQTVIRKCHYDLNYQLSLANLSTFLKMESWVIINTCKYLFYQVAHSHLVLQWSQRIRQNREKALKNSKSSAGVAHPIRLMQEVEAFQFAKKALPPYFQEIDYSKRISA